MLKKFLESQSNFTIWAIFYIVAELGTLLSVDYLGQGRQPTLGTWNCHLRSLYIIENADPTKTMKSVIFTIEELQCSLPVPLTLDLPQTVYFHLPTEGFIPPLPWHSLPWVELAPKKEELRTVGTGSPLMHVQAEAEKVDMWVLHMAEDWDEEFLEQKISNRASITITLINSQTAGPWSPSFQFRTS